MKSPDFAYHRPGGLDEALTLLARDGAMALAGGQSLMPMLNFRLAAPEALVDLNGIEGLDGVSLLDGWLRIGALTRYHALADTPDIAGAVPLIARVLPHIAHPAIRNRATIGGSCALADPAAEMPAVLLALGGKLEIHGTGGVRRVAAEDFFLGLYETALEPGEILTAIHVPVTAGRTGFHEIARRHGDYAMAGCVIAASDDLSVVRIALFGVADRAIRASGVETALAGSDGTAEAIEQAVEALAELEITGDIHTDRATKRHLAGVALQRAWREVTG